jgi:hypothetical protein
MGRRGRRRRWQAGLVSGEGGVAMEVLEGVRREGCGALSDVDIVEGGSGGGGFVDCRDEEAGDDGLSHGNSGSADGGPGGAVGGFVAGDGIAGASEFKPGVGEGVAAGVYVLVEAMLEMDAVVRRGMEIDVARQAFHVVFQHNACFSPLISAGLALHFGDNGAVTGEGLVGGLELVVGGVAAVVPDISAGGGDGKGAGGVAGTTGGGRVADVDAGPAGRQGSSRARGDGDVVEGGGRGGVGVTGDDEQADLGGVGDGGQALGGADLGPARAVGGLVGGDVTAGADELEPGGAAGVAAAASVVGMVPLHADAVTGRDHGGGVVGATEDGVFEEDAGFGPSGGVGEARDAGNDAAVALEGTGGHLVVVVVDVVAVAGDGEGATGVAGGAGLGGLGCLDFGGGPGSWQRGGGGWFKGEGDAAGEVDVALGGGAGGLVDVVAG